MPSVFKQPSAEERVKLGQDELGQVLIVVRVQRRVSEALTQLQQVTQVLLQQRQGGRIQYKTHQQVTLVLLQEID